MRNEASVLLLPSLHDQAGWIVGEALTRGSSRSTSRSRRYPPPLGRAALPWTDHLEQHHPSRQLSARQVRDRYLGGMWELGSES